MRGLLILAMSAAATFSPLSAAMAESVMLEVQYAHATLDGQTGHPIVTFQLSDSGRKAFTDLTTRHVGRQIDLLLDDVVLTSPVIQAPIHGRSLMISGDYTVEETEELAATLNAGAAIEARVPEE